MKNWIKAGLMAGLLAGVVSTTATEASVKVRKVMTPRTNAYVLCHSRNGDACAPIGFTFVCYNHYPDEPGLCECTDSGVWDCS